MKSMVQGFSLLDAFFITALISLLVINLFTFSISSLFTLLDYVFQETILSRLMFREICLICMLMLKKLNMNEEFKSLHVM